MKTTLVLILLLLGLEAGVRTWRYREATPSASPVFYWTGNDLVTDDDPTIGRVLEIYQADRGMQSFQSLPNAGRLQTMYIEWDDLEAGPFSALSGHETEVCNIAAGFTVLESKIPRVMAVPGGPPLEFYYARLTDPFGQIVHVYKMPWFQGLGAWNLDSIHDRSLRMKRPFIRHRGAARVLQFGVFGIPDEAAAWNLVQQELSERLVWSQP